MAKVIVREACEEDCVQIYSLSKDLMVFEHVDHIFKGTVESYRRDGFGKDRRFYCLVSEKQDEPKSESPGITGFLLYVTIYIAGSSKPALHIEELFIPEKNRRQGIGTELLRKALQIAANKGYCRAQLIVRKDNTNAIECYKKKGAINATDALGWTVVKLLHTTIKEHVEMLNKPGGPSSGEESQATISTKNCVTIRDAREDDCEEILEMMKKLAEYENEAYRLKVDKGKFKLDGFGEDRKFHCFVAEEGDISDSGGIKLVGVLLYTWIHKAYLNSDTMFIEILYVNEQNRRRGIGTALMGQALKTVAPKGDGCVEASVRQHNISAMNFFRKFGASFEEEENILLFEKI